MGNHNLKVSELTEESKNLKGEAYLKAVADEFLSEPDEGSEEDNKETSDKLFKK